MAGAQVSL